MEVGRISWWICAVQTHFQTSETLWGTYGPLTRPDILVRLCGSWEKFTVDQRMSRRILKEVKQSGVLTDNAHDLHACINVLMHIDMFSGIYTSLGSGDILVRMCGS